MNEDINNSMVEFKSIPEMYEKEKSGRKSNTIRKLPIGDYREEMLRRWASLVDYGKITIKNSETNLCFTRQITDITIYQGWIIISWKNN